MQSIFDEEFGDLKEFSFNPFTEKFKIDKVINGQVYQGILNDDKSELFMTQVETHDAEYA